MATRAARKHRTFTKAYAQAQKAKGLCLSCPRPAGTGDKHYCHLHWMMRRMNRAGMIALKTQPVKRYLMIEWLRARERAVEEGDIPPCTTWDEALFIAAGVFSQLKLRQYGPGVREGLAGLIQRMDQEAYQRRLDSIPTPPSDNTSP